MADALQTTPAALMGWSDAPTIPQALAPVELLHSSPIPLIGEVAAGVPILAEQDFDSLLDPARATGADYAFRVRGDSMSPTYLDGDVLFVRGQPTAEEGVAAVVLIDDSATVKRVCRTPEGLTLIADNPEYPPMKLRFDEHEHLHILGVVVGYLRTYRTDPVKGVRKGYGRGN